MRIESSRPARGNGGGWLHKLTDPTPLVSIPRRKPAPLIDWPRRARTLFNAPGAAKARIETAEGLGVSVESLERLGVGIGQDAGGQFTSWPERDPAGKSVGIVRRYADGSKKHQQGGHAGLYIAKDWHSSNGPIFLPEGGSDTAALLTMSLSAIGRPSNLGGIDHLAIVLRQFPKRAVVVLGENDRKPERIGTVAQCPADCGGCSWCWPGKYGATITAKRLSDLLGRKPYWRMVHEAKDSRGWLLSHGPDREAFIESLRNDRTKASIVRLAARRGGEEF